MYLDGKIREIEEKTYIHYSKSSIIPKLVIIVLGIVISIYFLRLGTTKLTIIGIVIIVIIILEILRGVKTLNEEKPIITLSLKGIETLEFGLIEWGKVNKVKIRGPIGSSVNQYLDIFIKDASKSKHIIRIDELEISGKELLNEIQKYRGVKK
ncbi:hypothetical protein [Saccharicrinis aurantiacus]|uniref:hypothetical protein n=1 Tax=Saccharicrinis aurantiacus TaxID=1849719 RepID=UPI0024922A5C|nr:hypothetical protein [Saccharicrinis aurantiacus]